jgi:hypothetical protein
MGRAGVDAGDVSVPWVGAAGSGEASAAPPPQLLPRVSSTEIREALAAGDVAAVSALVPSSVLAHILARGLYGAPVEP